MQRVLEAICLRHEHQKADREKPHPTINRSEASLMSRQLKISLLRAERQGEAGYEAAKGDVNRPDRHLFNRHCDGTGNEERPLRGTNPNRPDGGRCFHSLRI